MKVFLYILAAIRAVLVFGMMVIYMLLYGLSCIFVAHSPERAFRLRKHFLHWVCIPVLNIKIEATGKPAEYACLYVCNHRSFADPIVLCSFIDAFVIAKAEVKNYPIINKGAEITGVIWVDRQNQHSRTQTRSKLVETLCSGYNILVYPEGTVGKLRSTLPFRKGTFLEAAANGIEVMPVAIEYRDKSDLWVLQKFLPQYFYQFSKWSTQVKLSFGQPMKSEDGTELHDRSYQWINEELVKMQEEWSRMF